MPEAPIQPLSFPGRRSTCASRQQLTDVAAGRETLSTNVAVSELRQRIATVGNPDNHVVYGYVIATIRPKDAGFVQTGSGPNFDGALVTLCTCKHAMRATRAARQWSDQCTWIAGLTGWSTPFNKRQSLVYLMRVGEAYDSQASLVAALRASGRGHIVEAKASTRNVLGDIMIPKAGSESSNAYSAGSYETPLLGHAHRRTVDDTGWQADVDYVARGGTRPAMLAGDPEMTFIWTKPTVQRRRPGATRPYRVWTMSEFLDDLDAVST